MPRAKKSSVLLIICVLSALMSISASRPSKPLWQPLSKFLLHPFLSVWDSGLSPRSPSLCASLLCNQLINRKWMCHSITVFILEMDYRLGPRFIPKPTQGFKPSSINFIFTPVSKHGDSFISAAQVDNVLGFWSFFSACLATKKINRSVSNSWWK